MNKAYVLMRIYNPTVKELGAIDAVLNRNWSSNSEAMGLIEKIYYSRLNRALQSVSKNNANLIICDDTPRNDKWNRHNSQLQILLNNNFPCKDGLYLVQSCANQGSAMSMWLLRRYFIDITEHEPGAFAIILDQDDELNDNAVKDIEKQCSKNTVVVSSFSVNDPDNLNIIKDNSPCKKTWSILKRFEWYIPYFKTMGWTKAYSRNAMKTMVEDFEKYFKDNGNDISLFFNEYRAYDDFLDFYILVHKNIKIKINPNSSHIYYKHQDSITSNVKFDDFATTRPEILATLCKMCEHNASQLKVRWQKYLTKFMYIKITDIEAILAKYRNESKLGKIRLKEFEENTYPGWFARYLDSKYTELPLHNACTKYIRNMKEVNEVQDDMYQAITGVKKSVGQRQYKSYKILSWFLIVMPVILLTIIFVVNYITLYEGKILVNNGFRIDYFIEISSIIITLSSGIFTYTLKRKHEIKNVLNEEESIRKIFLSEFRDIIRHLDANLKVLIQIRIELDKRIDSNTKPASIHFENLKIPEDFAIFSEKILLLIDRKLVDDITRMQINLRNMNNSAKWLTEVVQDNKFSIYEIIKFIDWELCRIMAYYVNALYMAEHDFCFASEEQITRYFLNKDIKCKLTSLCLSLEEEEKQRFIAKCISAYFEDRRVKRKINLYRDNNTKSTAWFQVSM